jgi:hypothetical protein
VLFCSLAWQRDFVTATCAFFAQKVAVNCARIGVEIAGHVFLVWVVAANFSKYLNFAIRRLNLNRAASVVYGNDAATSISIEKNKLA